MQAEKKFNSIQVLRFFAAAFVAQFHLVPFMVSFQVGGAGVDIFFVISGIVIGLTPPNESSLYFLTKRITRIYPIYWICTALMIALNCYLWGRGRIPPVSDLFHSLALLPDSDHWVPVYFPAWTLAYEVLFYLIYTVMLLIPVERKNYICAALMVALSFTHFIGYATGNLMEFAFGLMIAECLMAGIRVPRRLAVALMLGVVAWFGYFYNASRYLPVPWEISRSVMWGIPSAIFIMSIITFDDSPIFNNRLLVYGGAASYCIYLLHITAGTLGTTLFWWGGIKTNEHPFMTVPFLVLGAVAAGLVAHTWIERPILGFVKRFVMAGIPKISSGSRSSQAAR